LNKGAPGDALVLPRLWRRSEVVTSQCLIDRVERTGFADDVDQDVGVLRAVCSVARQSCDPSGDHDHQSAHEAPTTVDLLAEEVQHVERIVVLRADLVAELDLWDVIH
jgi:hypothetical protein